MKNGKTKEGFKNKKRKTEKICHYFQMTNLLYFIIIRVKKICFYLLFNTHGISSLLLILNLTPLTLQRHYHKDIPAQCQSCRYPILKYLSQ